MDNYFELLKAALLEKGIHSVDVLIHNAGVSSRGYALDTAIETLHSVMVHCFTLLYDFLRVFMCVYIHINTGTYIQIRRFMSIHVHIYNNCFFLAITHFILQF